MYLREPIYLNGNSRARARKASPMRQIGNLLFIAAVVGANYFVFFHDDEAPVVPALDRAAEPEATPEATTPTRERAPERATPPAATPTATTVARTFAGRLGRGDTVFAALVGEGLDNQSISPVLAAMKDVFDFRKAQVGHRFRGDIDGSGRIVRFEYQTGPVDVYEVVFEGADYHAVKRNIPVDTRVATLGCTIGSSLFASLTRCGEGPELARMFSDLFAFDVDFFQEIRRGDTVRMLVEKVYVNGRFLKYGKVRAARYEGKFGAYTALLYEDGNGNGAYYTESGRALRKEFLKTPLKYTRISSGFTPRRFHPTLHKWRKHLAVDYAAPVNTPVQTVASGIVKFVGRKGASGNLVTVQHAGGYTSYYAHLNKFGGIEVGDRVSQRTVIGYVGQTGRATGPHLHFALKKGTRWVNPLEVKFTTANPISSGQKARFDAAVTPLLRRLRSIKVMGLSERQG